MATYGVEKSRFFGQTDAHPPVVAAFVVDLEDADGWGLAGRREMRAAAGLTIEAFDLDDANFAIWRRGRCDRATPDESGRGLRLMHRDIVNVYRDVLTDQVIDRSLKCTQAVVVRAGQVEVHACG